jgi:hypothetical protein
MKPETDEKTLAYKAYKSHLEPITDHRRSEIIFTDKFLEIIEDYDYKTKLGQTRENRTATLVPRREVDLCLTERWDEDDSEENANPVVVIKGYHISVETLEEASKIYNTIKKWLIQ